MLGGKLVIECMWSCNCISTRMNHILFFRNDGIKLIWAWTQSWKMGQSVLQKYGNIEISIKVFRKRGICSKSKTIVVKFSIASCRGRSRQAIIWYWICSQTRMGDRYRLSYLFANLYPIFFSFFLLWTVVRVCEMWSYGHFFNDPQPKHF